MAHQHFREDFYLSGCNNLYYYYCDMYRDYARDTTDCLKEFVATGLHFRAYISIVV